MKKIILMLLLFGLYANGMAKNERIKFLNLNIWQEGEMIEGGFEALADEIARVDADFVMLSEVRNYNNTRFCDRICAALSKRGVTYHSFKSYDSGLLSKYPIIDSTTIFPCVNDQGSVYKLTAKCKDRVFAVYTAHLDYRHCAYYDVRGYDGCTWGKLKNPLTHIPTILQKNVASKRDDGICAFIEDAQKEIEKGHFVFIGGDFNEPSLLDWIPTTGHIADHHGLAIPWTVTSLLQQNGFKDAYRVAHPNPLTHPGYTYPADTPKAHVDKLSWAKGADERERIDYIFYFPQPGLKVRKAYLLGPKGCIRKSIREEEKMKDFFLTPLGVWPTDHKGVVVEFKLK